MSAAHEDRYFMGALGLSIVAHVAVTLWSDGVKPNGPELALEEQQAQPPMTVRISQPAPRPRQEVREELQPVLASDAGTRTVQTPPVPVFQREEVELPPPVPIDPPLDIPPPEPDPPEPEPPRAVEPERVEPDPVMPDPIVPVPVQSDGQAAVRGRAVPDAKRNRPPNYPRRARAAGMKGTVELLVEVRANGTVESARVKKSSGHSLLDDAALKAVKKWRFKPAKGPGGAAVSDEVTVPVDFRLKGR